MTEFVPFSKKQLAVLSWWCAASRDKDKDAIICDGAVRSGKTLCMSISFVAWAMYAFAGGSFAICGKTIRSLRRNVVTPLISVLSSLSFVCSEKLSANYIDVSFAGRNNRFYLFGGKDESSAALIQGMTLSGVMFDEVALMPRSFVEQALARCSVKGSKYFFNCNPEHPFHWFYLEWIKKCEEKNALYIHFDMQDNPSLDAAILARYSSLYTGVFYERFVLGHWVVAQGLVYPMFDPKLHIADTAGHKFSQYYISCDYGTVNPCSMGLWGECEGVWYRLREYYFDSRRRRCQRTDEEHYEALCTLAGSLPIAGVIVDPSAASFIEAIRRHGRFAVQRADNDVLNGIRRVCDALKAGRILFAQECGDTVREFGLYRWDEESGRDVPIKENDHAMDDIRYFVSTVLQGESDDFFVLSTERGR